MIISNEFIEQYKGKQPNWGFGDLSYIVYKRSYARLIAEENRTEEYYETLQREINGAQELGADYTQEEAERLFKYMWDLKCSYAGRMKWQLGTDTVRRFGGNSLLNCWFVNMNSINAFLFLFENLMLGGGVGFSVKKEVIYELPKIQKGVDIEVKNTKDAGFIVPDSREGWIKLLKHVLVSFFETGESFTYSTMLIRGYGEKISTFGGTASGPQILVDGITDICKIFKNREGKKLRSIDVLDINNIIGKIVVSGNVRRSAEIAIGDPDDALFLEAKRWDKIIIPNWRGMSNNSVYCKKIEHLDDTAFWIGYKPGHGEPYGLINMDLSRRVGRLKDVRKDVCEGVNPCAEILLSSYECCNLSEIFLNNIENKEELKDISKLLYKLQKAICNMRYIHKETEEIVHKNNRIGVGVTGVCQSIDKIEWLDETYNELREFDKEYSKLKGWNESIRLTTIKPSGSLGLLGGSTPGIHPGYSEYQYRTVRMSSTDKLIEYCKKKNYRMEFEENNDGSINRETLVVYFPTQIKNAIYSKDITAIQHLELVKRLQTEWSDNSISVTVYYSKEELEGLKQWLRDNYRDGLKTVSFLLHQEHGFKQAPIQPIDKDEYEKAIKRIKVIEPMKIETDERDIQDCEGGSCGVNDIIIN